MSDLAKCLLHLSLPAVLTALALPLGCSKAPELQRVQIKATSKGFDPAEVRLKKGRPARLEFVRTEASECLKAVKMPWMKEPKALPLGQKVEIDVQTSHAGTFTYACWMNMATGRVLIE